MNVANTMVIARKRANERAAVISVVLIRYLGIVANIWSLTIRNSKNSCKIYFASYAEKRCAEGSCQLIVHSSAQYEDARPSHLRSRLFIIHFPIF